MPVITICNVNCGSSWQYFVHSEYFLLRNSLGLMFKHRRWWFTADRAQLWVIHDNKEFLVIWPTGKLVSPWLVGSIGVWSAVNHHLRCLNINPSEFRNKKYSLWGWISKFYQFLFYKMIIFMLLMSMRTKYIAILFRYEVLKEVVTAIRVQQ
jgi:hypothetical protein